VKDEYPFKLSQRLGRLRWQLPAFAFLLVLVEQFLQHTWLVNLPDWGHFASQVFFYGVTGSALAWWALTLLRRRVDEREAVQQKLEEAHSELTEANQRLEFLMRVNRRLAEAEDEESLFDVILGLPLEVVPALGCSLIRLDERGQPLPAMHRGSLDAAVFDAWATHLSGAENRPPCENCLASRVSDSVPCPLATSLTTAAAVSHVHCLALARGGRAYGSLNIYLHDASDPDRREEALLGAMANEISWALESQHLRSRELAALYHLQQARRLTDLHDTLAEGVANVSDGSTLDADTGQVSWELGDVGPGVEASLAYDVTLTPRFPPGTTSVNHQVTITSEEGTSPASDRQAFTVTVQPKMTALLERMVVDLNDNGAVDPGDTIRYRVTYPNQRDVDASGVKIVAVTMRHSSRASSKSATGERMTAAKLPGSWTPWGQGPRPRLPTMPNSSTTSQTPVR